MMKKTLLFAALGLMSLNIAAQNAPKEDEGYSVCMVTKNGVIKRTALSDFRNIRRSGIIAINLDENDVLENVRLTAGGDDIFVATRKGLGIRFHESDARVIGRTARGVKAISFKSPDDCVVGVEVIGENETEGRLLTVSAEGTGRKSEYSDYRAQGRGGYGCINYRTELYGEVAAVLKIYDDEDVILISAAGIVIRLDSAEIRACSRPSKGVRLMKLAEGDRVIAVTTAKKAPEEPDDAPEEEDASETEQAPEAQAAAAVPETPEA